MPKRSSKRQDRQDLNEVAASIVQEATDGGDTSSSSTEPAKNPAAVALGRLGGKKGGSARAKKLTPERRSEIARQAAMARWAARQR